jgi:hypothetical protein
MAPRANTSRRSSYAHRQKSIFNESALIAEANCADGAGERLLARCVAGVCHKGRRFVFASSLSERKRIR